MEEIKEEESLFVQLDGDYNFNNNEDTFDFKLYNNNIFQSEYIHYIADPTYQVTFKFIFGGKKGTKRLLDFLNSISFFECDIDNVEIVDDKYMSFRNLEIYDSLITNIPFWITLKKDKFFSLIQLRKRKEDYHLYKDKNFCFLEIYISISLEKEDEINNIITKKKITVFTKEHFKTIGTLYLDKELENIKSGKESQMKIGKKGKEWIKLLTLNEWAKLKDKKYVIPNIDKITSNPILKETMYILGSFDQISIFNYIFNEDSVLDMFKEKYQLGYQMGLIQGIFENFEKMNFLDQKLKGKFKEFNKELILDSLKGKIKELNKEFIFESLKDKNQEKVKQFIEFLQI